MLIDGIEWDNKKARLADKNDRRSYFGYYQINGIGWTKAL